ncbi:MFS transporter [Pseudoalteromonas sp. McH1-7]|uniref:MFS transporter n=1 Tax=Pseudoalteromonas sp. McH1-7 TaxID=2745574 RepID=UPI0015919334|nr:MFS transporter [Pseudoalteromonas sp. McH1-7]NUZ09171.1 MFS transporter [Pseudoalteromonas sp. McH1-7]
MLSASLNNSVHSSATFGLCFAIHFLLALDALIIVPFSAQMALSTHTNPANSGLLVAVYAVTASLVCLWVRGGENAGNESRKLISLLLAAAFFTLCTALLNSFYSLLVVRALTGLCAGAALVLNLNLVVLLSDHHNKKRNTAILLSTFPCALAIGIPVLLFITEHVGWQSSIFLLGCCLAITALLFLLIFMQKHKRNIPASVNHDCQIKQNNIHLFNKKLSFALLFSFVVVMSTFIISTQFPVMLITNFSISNTSLSYCYLLSGVCSFIVIQLYARSKFSNRTTSYLVYFLSGVMLLTVLVGFNTSRSTFSAALFILFIIASSCRSMILVTELIVALQAQERSAFISLQNAIQHFAIAASGIFASLLVKTEDNQTLNFNTLVAVATLLISVTIVMWKHVNRLGHNFTSESQ